MVAGSDIAEYARTKVGPGHPYVWGAEGPDAFDCSGLVEYVYKHFGLTTPRTTSAMMGAKSNLTPITRADLQPGDLIFSNWTGEPHSHVGIYAGDNQIIEAPEPGKNVTVTTLGNSYWSHTDAYRRVPGIAGATAGSGSTNPILNLPGVSTILGFIPNPSSVTEAITNIGAGVAGIAQSAASVGKVGEAMTRAFLPSNLIRAAAFVFGTVFVLIGIWFLAREVKESSA